VVLAYRQHGHNITNNYSYMLRSGLGVRRRFYPMVKHDPRLKKAWQTGIRSVQADIGRKLWNQTRDQLKKGKLDRRLLQNLACLATNTPRQVLKALINGVAGRLQIRIFKHTKTKKQYGN
jgi:hypothetical protein